MSKGIDISIDALVEDMSSHLWTGNNTSFYGRVFRNIKNDKISPEIWTAGDRYIEVLKNTKKDAQCFFDVQPQLTLFADIHTADVWLCFMVNLYALYPALSRMEAIEQVHRDTEHFVENSLFENKGLIPGVEGFVGYNGIDQVLFDMSPNYVFRFNLTRIYTIQK